MDLNIPEYAQCIAVKSILAQLASNKRNIMNIRKASLTELISLHNQIVEFLPIDSADYFAARIGDKNYLALVAEIDGVTVGYKLGYWLSAELFYSWLGGVHPAYRQQGIAKLLLHEQERQVRAQGAIEIQVKSTNRFKSMLQFLIAQDYEIIGTEPIPGRDTKILFSKCLIAAKNRPTESD